MLFIAQSPHRQHIFRHNKMERHKKAESFLELSIRVASNTETPQNKIETKRDKNKRSR